MSIRIPSLSVLSLSVLATLACSDVADEGMSLESGLTSGTFMYLRCNSTSWNVDAKSRMQDTGVTDVVELTFDVKHSWMMTAGDDCVLTETPAKDSWGNWQKYYTTASAPVTAPSTVRYSDTARTPKNFRVRFPELGRFRAVVDTKTKSFFIAKAGELEPGQVTWTAAGEIARDAHQRLFRLDPTRNRLELLDRATGAALWSYASSTGEYLTYVPACALSNMVVALQGKRLVALDATNGALRWTSSIDGAADGPLTQVYPPVCREDLGKVFVSYYGGPDGVAGLALADGRTVWNKRAATTNPWISAVTATALIVTEPSAVRALNPADGRELTLPAGPVTGDTFFADAADNLFWFRPDNLTRLDLGSASMPTRKVTSIVSSAERDAIYVASPGGKVEKLRASDLSTIWSYSDTSSAASIRLVAGGNVVLTSSAGGTSFTVLDAASGAARFTRTYSQSYAYMEADPLGRLFVVQGDKLDQLGTSGETLWTYVAPVVEGYGQSHVQSVVDGDARGVYITFADWGYGTAPGGLAALDPAARSARWTQFETLSMVFVGSDLLRLFMQVSGRGGPVEGRAYAK